MDAVLEGVVPEPADRDAALALVDGIQGLRAVPEHNHLRIPGRVRLQLEPGSTELRLSGRLGDLETARRLVVALQEIEGVDAVDVDGLEFLDTVTGPGYLETEAFLDLARAFFSIPGNGALAATESGITLRGLATAQAREAWERAEKDLALQVNPSQAAAAARMVWGIDESSSPGSEGAPAPPLDRFLVRADVTFHPSPWHVPGYRPEAPLPADRLRHLVSVLDRSAIVFAPGSAETGADQTGKLEAAARAIQAAGERVRYVVGGHCVLTVDGAEAARREARARAEAVVSRLVALGVSADQLAAEIFPSPAGSGRPDAPRFRTVDIRVR
jgi:outer membrane protein OmpA-like peptidoglycan-associated protein